MSKFSYGLWLFGAAHICGCSPSAEDVTRVSNPLLEATRSTRTDVVAIIAAQGLDEQLCTGSLLVPNLVLTARHCLTVSRQAIASGDCATAVVPDPDPGISVTVIPGADVDLVPEDAQHKVSKYILPDDEGRLCGQDIALLLLEEPIVDAQLLDLSPTIPGVAAAPIASQDAQRDAQGSAGAGGATPSASAAGASSTRFTAVGYGLFDGDWGQQRQRIDASISCAGSACGDTRLVANEFLANSGACDGDSGGPAVNQQGAAFALASRSTADCSESAYLSLGSYYGWLKSAVSYAAEAGGYSVPSWVLGEPKPVEQEPVPNEKAPDIRARGGCSLTPARLPNETGILALLGVIASIARRRHPRLHPRRHPPSAD